METACECLPHVLTSPSLLLQDGFPIRIKAVHVVNEPRIFKGIFAIIKPFLKEKIANRVSDDSFNLILLFLLPCDINKLLLVYYFCPGMVNLERTDLQINDLFCERKIKLIGP